ncbi:dynein light chain, cytoplasmic-like [Neltuma alba]|uniref:dynein light chain, cytoplasmic-like n=1 Tax=Neltuma alba TaxID=207710 RepID=UPI0010A4C42C|nr:dynein light chain, cytoplasmic-like [Prosopis alba]
MEEPKLTQELREERLEQNKLKQREASHEVRLAALAITFNARLRSSDMPLNMQEHALRYTRSLVGDPSPSSSKPRHNPTHLARALKKEFDSVYGPAWHCVIGKSFGSFVTHTAGGFVYFSIDSLFVLLFKTEVHLVTQPPPILSK